MLVRYFATLRDITRKAQEPWAEPAADVGTLVHALVARYGPGFGRWVMPDGQHLGLAVVLVNGHDVRSLQGLETPLQPDDEVFIFPPVAGG